MMTGAVALALCTTGVEAQNVAVQTTSADVPARIDSSAMNALQRMGTYLRTLQTFRVHADITTEQVLDDGLKVQHTRKADLLAVRPNKLRINIDDELAARVFYYDGTSFAMWAPRTQYYALQPAPGTIKELAVELEDKYDLELPLVDMFRWGTDEEQISDITHARDLGPSQVDGTTCQHYAFRQDGLDWQVWIQNGDYALPRKVVLTTTDDEARPQYAAVYRWDLAPSFNSQAFVFTAPPDAKRITMAEVNAMRTNK
jgi:hypothetical protein